jgi:hypothetical protein
MRLLVIFIGSIISFALPALSQKANTPDPQLRQRLVAAIKKHTDALDKNDAGAVAGQFTEDGILVTETGRLMVGRQLRSITKTCLSRFVSAMISPRSMRIPRTL